MLPIESGDCQVRPEPAGRWGRNAAKHIAISVPGLRGVGFRFKGFYSLGFKVEGFGFKSRA